LKNRILIVDDDPQILKMLRHFLSSQFMEPYTAESAVKAVQLLREVKPHLIITDLDMPGIDGFKLTQTLKKTMTAQSKNIPMIILSGMTDPNTEKKSYEMGADFFMKKPPRLNVLLLRIQELLGTSKIK